jgi:hypothetical protein
MIGKVMHNSSFRATTRYVLEKAGATTIGGSVSGESVKEVVAEFMWSKDLNPSLKHPVWHMSLSLPHDEHLSDDQFSDLATQYFAGMVLLADDPKLVNERDRFQQQRDEFILDGLSEYQYLVARHSDQQHDHVHIVASRINLSTGKGVELWRDKTRNQKILRCLETEYGLTQVPNSWEVGRKSATKGQLEKQAQTGEESVQSRLQGLIEQAAIDQPTMPLLFERLMRSGVEVRHGWTRTGKSKGISYALDGVAFAGNQLGSRYSFPGLQKHLGVSYEAERDDEKLRSLLDHGIAEIDRLEQEQQRQLAIELANSTMRILRQVGLPNERGRIAYARPNGVYRLEYDPALDTLMVSKQEDSRVILAAREGKVLLEYCRVSEQDLAQFHDFEFHLEQRQQRQQGEQAERQRDRNRGFER